MMFKIQEKLQRVKKVNIRKNGIQKSLRMNEYKKITCSTFHIKLFEKCQILVFPLIVTPSAHLHTYSWRKKYW